MHRVPLKIVLYVQTKIIIVTEYRLGTSGPGQGGQGVGNEAYGRDTDIRHAPEAQRQHAALSRRDAFGQRPVQVSSVVHRQADGRVADHIPRHGLLPGHRLRPARKRD